LGSAEASNSRAEHERSSSLFCRIAPQARRQRSELSQDPEARIERFLTSLAVERNVSPSTQNQTLSAILYLYREVLGCPLTDRIDAVRAVKKMRWQVVISVDVTCPVLALLERMPSLMARLIYGSGIWTVECVRVRVQDVDFEMNSITVCSGMKTAKRDAGPRHIGRHSRRLDAPTSAATAFP